MPKMVFIMYNSLLYNLNVLAVSDTTIVNLAVDDSNTVTQPLPVNFIQMDNVQISPVLHLNDLNTDITAYVLLILLGIISVIWYFFPDRFSTIFSLKPDSKFQRAVESSTKVPGTLITGFFWLNFIISTGIFILLVLQRFFGNEITGLSDYEILSYVFIALSGLLLYRFMIIFGTAFVFQTQKLMKQQVITGRNILFITGVLLVPFILVILYTGGNVIMYTAIVTIVLLQVYRLVQIVIIGKSSTIFSALHIILYLCTLEIVPVLVLIRLIGNGSGI